MSFALSWINPVGSLLSVAPSQLSDIIRVSWNVTCSGQPDFPGTQGFEFSAVFPAVSSTSTVTIQAIVQLGNANTFVSLPSITLQVVGVNQILSSLHVVSGLDIPLLVNPGDLVGMSIVPIPGFSVPQYQEIAIEISTNLMNFLLFQAKCPTVTHGVTVGHFAWKKEKVHQKFTTEHFNFTLSEFSILLVLYLFWTYWTSRGTLLERFNPSMEQITRDSAPNLCSRHPPVSVLHLISSRYNPS